MENAKILNILNYQDLKIVLYEHEHKKGFKNNVKCFNDRNQELWTIESTPDSSNLGMMGDHYAYIFIEDGLLVARTFTCEEWQIDPKTGKRLKRLSYEK